MSYLELDPHNCHGWMLPGDRNGGFTLSVADFLMSASVGKGAGSPLDLWLKSSQLLDPFRTALQGVMLRQGPITWCYRAPYRTSVDYKPEFAALAGRLLKFPDIHLAKTLAQCALPMPTPLIAVLAREASADQLVSLVKDEQPVSVIGALIADGNHYALTLLGSEITQNKRRWGLLEAFEAGNFWPRSINGDADKYLVTADRDALRAALHLVTSFYLKGQDYTEQQRVTSVFVNTAMARRWDLSLVVLEGVQEICLAPTYFGGDVSHLQKSPSQLQSFREVVRKLCAMDHAELLDCMYDYEESSRVFSQTGEDVDFAQQFALTEMIGTGGSIEKAIAVARQAKAVIPELLAKACELGADITHLDGNQASYIISNRHFSHQIPSTALARLIDTALENKIVPVSIKKALRFEKEDDPLQRSLSRYIDAAALRKAADRQLAGQRALALPSASSRAM